MAYELDFIKNNKIRPKIERAEEKFQDKMMLAHFSEAELSFFDQLQGGTHIEPETGLREYSLLLNVFNDPGIKRRFEAAIDYLHENSQLDKLPDIKKLSKELTPSDYDRAPGDSNPLGERLIKHGRMGDNEIAWMPIEVLDYFDTLLGKPEINPQDGLPEYFFFLLPMLGALGGGALASGLGLTSALGIAGLGTAIGAGAGSMLGAKFAGAKTKDLWKYGLAGGAAGYGVHSLGGLSGIGAKLGLGAAAGAAAGAKGLAAAGAAPAAGAVGAAAPAAAATGIGGMIGKGLGALAPHAVPLLGISALLAKGHSDSKKQMAKDLEERRRQSKSAAERFGLNTKFDLPISKHERSLNPSMQDPLDRFMGREHNYFLSRYKDGGKVLEMKSGKGGLLHGPGKGQDDKILVDYLDQGDYIMDAASVSNLGDGSTNAGARMLHKFLSGIEPMRESGANKKVKAALSDGEYRIPADQVTGLGDGNNAKGAELLDHFRKTIRKAKGQNPKSIPPKLGKTLMGEY